MKVLFFLPQLGGGGAEMNAVRLATGLLAVGVTPIYAVARGPGSYAEFLPEGVEVSVLETGGINSSTLRLIRARSALARLIDECQPDVLCPVLVGPSLAARSALRGARYQPCTVLSIQNSLALSHGPGAKLYYRLELSLMRRSFPFADGVITLSQGVAAEIREFVPALADRIEVIPNIGLPLPAQLAAAKEKTSENSHDDTINLLACGRLTEQKDYPTLFQALTNLSGDQPVRLDILGDGALREELEAHARALGLQERIRFLGFQHDPLSYMRRADIFVLSSRWEGFGNVLVEAMAMGTPVISTDCPHGPGEILCNGETGLLVPPRDPEAMSHAITRLIEDPELRARLGKAGQQRAQDFSADRIGRAYAQAFRAFAERAA